MYVQYFHYIIFEPILNGPMWILRWDILGTNCREFGHCKFHMSKYVVWIFIDQSYGTLFLHLHVEYIAFCEQEMWISSSTENKNKYVIYNTYWMKYWIENIDHRFWKKKCPITATKNQPKPRQITWWKQAHRCDNICFSYSLLHRPRTYDIVDVWRISVRYIRHPLYSEIFVEALMLPWQTVH